MATNIQTGYLLKTTWDSDVTIVDTTAGQEPDATLAAGTYMAFAFLAEEVTIAAPDAFVLAQWSVEGNSTEGELVFTISSLPNRNGSKIDKFQYALDGDQVTPTWTDLPAGTTTGTYTATGVTDGTYTGTVAIRAVTSAGDGAVSDLKTATVAGGTTSIVLNGGFDDASNWILPTEGTISGGTMNFATTTTRRVRQAYSLVAGNTYRFTFDVPSYTSGSVRAQLHGGTAQNGASVSAAGTNKGPFDIIAVSGNTHISLETGGASTLSVDNLVVLDMGVV